MSNHSSTKKAVAGRKKTAAFDLEALRMSRHPALKRVAERSTQKTRLSSYSSKDFVNKISS
jgi:hypothetical protein